MKKIIIIAGARPNFIKIAPLIREIEKIEKGKLEYRLVHTGQHYNKNMSDVFFKGLKIPEPHINLEVGSSSHSTQIAQIMIKLEKYVLEYSPDHMIVVGDVNSSLAAAIVASKMGISLSHIEAGLRSNDKTMPEEINRILIDHLANFLFVPDESGLQNLRKEGIKEDSCFFVGNIMIDALNSIIPKLKENKENQKYALVTIHRPSNVDNMKDLENIIDILDLISKDYKIFWPIHPRTEKKMNEFQLVNRIKEFEILKPLGYIEFINLVYNSSIVVTDSGGIQEETSYLKIPCITLRYNTEWLSTLSEGTNYLTGPEISKVKEALIKIKNISKKQYGDMKYRDGKTAKRILDTLINLI